MLTLNFEVKYLEKSSDNVSWCAGIKCSPFISLSIGVYLSLICVVDPAKPVPAGTAVLGLSEAVATVKYVEVSALSVDD